MTILQNWVFTLVKLFHSVKNENLHWKKANQDQQVALKHARVLSEKTLEAKLRKKSLRLEHEITLLRTKNDAELSMLKTKCKQDIRDYKQYLESLDQLKSSIKMSYTHLPEAVTFTIHHHAKQLLNQMWETEDFEQKIRHEIQLINFMTTVHEDARLYLEGVTTENMPERTLKLIQKL